MTMTVTPRASIPQTGRVAGDPGGARPGPAAPVLRGLQAEDPGRVRGAGPGRQGRVVAPRRLVHLADQSWREQRDQGALEALGKPAGHPAADVRDRELARLR